MPLTRRQSQTLSAIRTHFRETGCPPSIRDIARRLKCSPENMCRLLVALEKAGLITRRKGEAHSIRLVEAMGNFSDDDLISQLADVQQELTTRGIGTDQLGTVMAIKNAYTLTELQLPADDFSADILAQLEGGDVGGGGQEQGTGQLGGFPGARSRARRITPAAEPAARAA